METTTAQLIEKLEAFKKAFCELSGAWETAKEQDEEKLNNELYPFKFSFDEKVIDVRQWVELSIESLNSGFPVFIFNGTAIHNPYRDETGMREVDPFKYYFVQRDTIEKAVSEALKN